MVNTIPPYILRSFGWDKLPRDKKTKKLQSQQLSKPNNRIHFALHGARKK